MSTERQRRIAKILTETLPRVPFIDAEAIRLHAGSRHLRELSPQAALWLAAIAHIRHAHTAYDALRDEGYGKEEARFFVVDETNAVLDRWGSTRHLSSEPEEEDELGTA